MAAAAISIPVVIKPVGMSIRLLIAEPKLHEKQAPKTKSVPLHVPDNPLSDISTTTPAMPINIPIHSIRFGHVFQIPPHNVIIIG